MSDAAAMADLLESGNWTTVDVHAAAALLRKLHAQGATRMFIRVAEGVIAPQEGWQPNTYYLVNVKLDPRNVLHRAVFYSGFLNDQEEPEEYNTLWAARYNQTRRYSLDDVWHMSVVKVLGTRQDFEAPEELKDDPEDDI